MPARPALTGPPSEQDPELAFRRYQNTLGDEFPELRFVDKRCDRLSRTLDRLLRILTFGRQRAFLTDYVTTLGTTIYLPPRWADWPPTTRHIVLRHEAVHLRQFRRLGWFGMAIWYVFPLCPLGLAWGRARLEWEAYRETLRATAELRGLAAAQDPNLHRFLVRQFTTGAYGWMWPFPRQVQRWIDEAVRALVSHQC